jgi:8-oxo-dGTP pyrophosphatase MutT (NUDIX family)
MRWVGRARSLLLRLFATLPPRLRRGLVRSGVTTYTVGCVAVIERDARVLLLEQPHRAGLTLPGGLLRRHESPVDCLRREVREELGVDVACRPQPDAVVVDGRARRVDLVFLVADAGLDYAGASPEVTALRWVAPSGVPSGSATARALEAVLSADRGA